MSRILQLVSVLFLSVFVFVEAAQAGLIRGGGRAELSRVYEQTLYYVNDQYNNAAGIDIDAIDLQFAGEQFFSTRPRSFKIDRVASTQAYINGDNNPLSAFPNGEGCTRGYQEDVVRDSEERFDELDGIGSSERTAFEENEYLRLGEFIAEVGVNDPCKWQFNQGEQISLEGVFGSVFTNLTFGLTDYTSEIDYSVDWKIDGQSYGGEIGLVDGQRFAPVSLNKFIDLEPGEYTVDVTVALSSLLGKFYYTNPGPSDGSEVPVSFDLNCADNPEYIPYDDFEASFFLNNPGATEDDVFDAYLSNPNIVEDTVCGYTGVLQDSNVGRSEQINVGAPTFFSSFSETLIIVAVDNDDPAAVSAPTTFGILLTGLAALGIRRRVAKK